MIYWTKTLNKVFKYNQSGKKKKKQTMSKEQKKNKRSHQIEDTYKEMEVIKNHIETLQLKSTVINMKNSWPVSIIDSKGQKKHYVNLKTVH